MITSKEGKLLGTFYFGGTLLNATSLVVVPELDGIGGVYKGYVLNGIPHLNTLEKDGMLYCDENELIMQQISYSSLLPNDRNILHFDFDSLEVVATGIESTLGVPKYSSTFQKLLFPGQFLKNKFIRSYSKELLHEWDKVFRIDSSLWVENAFVIDSKLDVTHTGDSFLYNYYEIDSLKGSTVIKVDNNGVAKDAVYFDTLRMSEVLASNENVLLLRKLQTENGTDTLLFIQLDSNLNQLWAKKIFANNFKFYDLDVRVAEDGYIYLAYSTFGFFPIILAVLDGNGEIVRQSGYSNPFPRLYISQNPSLYFNSFVKVDSGYRPLIAKIDSLGNVANCEVYPTCLQVIDANVPEFTHVSVLAEDYPALELERDTFELTVRGFTFIEYCDSVESVSPNFNSNEIVCLGDTLLISEVRSENANREQWEITLHDTVFSWYDSVPVSVYFDVPGTYVITHRIWVLGCMDEFSREIKVLDSLKIKFSLDDERCFSPSTLQVNSNRPLTTLTWSTGETTHSIEITTGGHYAVTATDGYCTATDSIDVVFVSETLGGHPSLELPPDTTVCQQHLPYMLKPVSNFTDSFLVNGRLHVNTPAELFRPGEYEVAALIEGCAFPDTFQLDTSACHVKVYFPSAFSPNGDGINDEYKPLAGKDVQMLELWIFDRWGGLRHHSKGALGSWDGRGAPEGTYVAKLKFRNLLTGFEEMREADFTLLR
ncbi:MAG: hypothetical protein Kow0027_24310 [Saprospiraceae bacterium]